MAKSGKNDLHLREMFVVEAEGIVLLDAVAVTEAERRIVHLFFRNDADTLRVFPGKDLTVLENRSIGGAIWWTCETTKMQGSLKMVFEDTEVTIDPSPAELGMFGGKNCFVSVRNGESADTVLAWPVSYTHLTLPTKA